MIGALSATGVLDLVQAAWLSRTKPVAQRDAAVFLPGLVAASAIRRSLDDAFRPDMLERLLKEIGNDGAFDQMLCG